MIWIPLLPVPEGPLVKVWGSSLPSLIITSQPEGSQQETIHLRELHHHHQAVNHRVCFVHPQRTGGVHQVPMLILLFRV